MRPIDPRQEGRQESTVTGGGVAVGVTGSIPFLILVFRVIARTRITTNLLLVALNGNFKETKVSSNQGRCQ